jgi:hypothetical protein
MLSAVAAEFLQFQTFRSGLLVFGRRIVPVLALGALEGDNLSRHFSTPWRYALTIRNWKKLEPLTGIEPVTSSLPRTRSTN